MSPTGAAGRSARGAHGAVGRGRFGVCRPENRPPANRMMLRPTVCSPSNRLPDRPTADGLMRRPRHRPNADRLAYGPRRCPPVNRLMYRLPANRCNRLKECRLVNRAMSSSRSHQDAEKTGRLAGRSPARRGRPATVRLQLRDRAILDVLVRRVRALSLDQVARTWWSGGGNPSGGAAARLRDLADAGLVDTFSMTAHPELPLHEPAAVWQPGQAVPDFGQVARVLARRWDQPVAATRCVVATEAAGARFGGSGGRYPSEDELTHDLHLAAVYLRMRAELPTRAALWTAEADLPKGQGVKVPDAVVRDGLERTAIEFVGSSYSAAKLERFHRYCRAVGLGYELW